MTGAEVDLEFDLDELVGILGAPTRLSAPERGYFWFSYERRDGVVVTLTVSTYERAVAVIVRISEEVVAGSVRLESCDAVRVLETDRRTLEVVAQDPRLRLVLALDGDAILDLAVRPDPAPGS